jgi:cysteine desulfurase/selenocysteine lyase
MSRRQSDMLDVAKIRKDFPILGGRKPIAYLDSAATSQRPEQVLEAVDNFNRTYNANVHRGLYAIAEEATLRYEESRAKAGNFINAPGASQVIFTRNTTEALNTVMRGWGGKSVKKGDKVVTTILEHHSNFVPWQQLAKMTGAKFEVVGMDDDGQLDEVELERALRGAKLFAFSAASNVLGTLSDAKKLCAMASENGAVSVVDAAQYAPSFPVDVKRMGCDFLAFSGHKMLAPFGVGVLYGRAELLEEMDPFIYGSEMIRSVTIAKSQWNDLPYKFESGTPDVGAVIGLGAAIDYLKRAGMENLLSHERMLTAYMLRRLGELRGVSVLGPKDAEKRAGLVAFTVAGVHPHDVAAMLSDDGVCVRSGHHCAMPLHGRLGIPASTRASVYIYNTKEEVDRLVQSLGRVRKTFG